MKKQIRNLLVVATMLLVPVFCEAIVRQQEDIDGKRVMTLLHFNEGDGPVAFDDDDANRGRNSDATLNKGAAFKPGWKRAGVYFDGVDDYLEIKDNDSLDADDGVLCVEMFLKVDQQAGRKNLFYRTFKEDGGQTTGWALVYFSHGGGRVTFEFNAWSKSSVVMNVKAKTTLKEGVWCDVAAVADGEMGRIYVDGKLVGYGKSNLRRLPENLAAPIYIGGSSETEAKRHFKGMIDELMISGNIRKRYEASAEMPVHDIDSDRPKLTYGRPTSLVDWGGVKIETARGKVTPQEGYCIDVEVESDDKNQVPAYLDIDFAKVLGRFGVEKRGGILVEVVPENKGFDVSYKIDQTGNNKARVRWLADMSKSGKYSIRFSLNDGEGIKAMLSDKPVLVGDGDLFVKKKVIGSLFTKALGAAIFDWDSDGDLDYITTHFPFPPSPLHGVRLFKNIKDDPARPLFETVGTPLRDAQNRFLYVGGFKNGYRGVSDVKFVDWDGDSDRDIVVWGEKGRFLYYENSGDDSDPIYVESTRIFKQANGKPFTGSWLGGWYFDVIDWEADGDYDFVFVMSGSPRLFLNSGSNSKPVIEDKGDIKIGGEIIKGGQSVTHSITISDWDMDGKFDLLISLTGTGGRRPVMLARNIGTLKGPSFAKLVPVQVDGHDLVGGYHTRVLMVDWDGDGKKDLIVTRPGNVDIYLNGGSRKKPVLKRAGKFTAKNETITVGFDATASVVDFDYDGDYDVIAGNSSGCVYYFENTGSNKNPLFADSKKIKADGKEIDLFGCTDAGEWEAGYSRVVATDWDGDGDYDLIVGDHPCNAHFYENAGTRAKPKFLADQPLQVNGGPLNFNAGRRIRPAVVDWDGDGDLDLVSSSNGKIRFFERVGKIDLKPGVPIKYSDGSEISPQVQERNTVVAADWDGDGKKDLIVWPGYLYDGLSNYVNLYINSGDGTNHVFEARKKLSYPMMSHHECSQDLVDWNGDGDLDLVFGLGDSGRFTFYEHSYFSKTKVKVKSISVQN
jgi:Concanavalin A-like lectin/glucanases superfamily/FG-GAP-like repeat